MKFESLRKSTKASFILKLHLSLAARSGIRERKFKLFLGGNFLLLASIPIILACLLSQTVFASEFCTRGSAVDQVSFFVGQSFLDILNRAPGGGEGQTFWISKLQGLNTNSCKSANPALSAGACEWNNNAQITLDILSSPESTLRNGSLTSNDAFVTVLYKILLRRAPDEPGLKSHLSVLASGGTRLSVVSRFLSSDEYRRRFTCTSSGTSNPTCAGAASVDPIMSFVTQTQRDILGRDPDTASLASGTNYMNSNQVAMCQNVSATSYSACDRVIEVQMIMDTLNGNAYQKSLPPIVDNKAFVTALYRHLLQRVPDEGGLQFHLKYLNETNDRLGTIYSFLTSNEYRKRFTCNAGTRDYTNLGINGHPIAQPAYSDTEGVSFDDQLTLVHNAGAQWFRFDVGAPSAGADFTNTDALLKKAQAHGVTLLPIIFSSADRAHDSLSTIYTKSYDGAFKFVSHYKSALHVWELSNEEDVYSITGGSGEQITDYDPHKYAIAAAVLRGLAEGVRAADGNALRIINFGGWLHTGFFQRLEDDHIPYDIAGIHWYQNMGEITCPGQALPCPARLQHFNVVQRVQTITHGKPMWMTETNYAPLPTNTVAMNISRKEKYLTAVLQTYLNSPTVYPFQTVMVYELLDEPNLQAAGVTQTQMGLYSVTSSAGRKYALGSPKPEYQVLRNLFAH
jgi:hypothetical protein